MKFMHKLGFYAITVLLNIMYYICKPAELFTSKLRFGEMFSHLKDFPHWIVESFTSNDVEDWDDEEYLNYTFKGSKAA